MQKKKKSIDELTCYTYLSTLINFNLLFNIVCVHMVGYDKAICSWTQ